MTVEAEHCGNDAVGTSFTPPSPALSPKRTKKVKKVKVKRRKARDDAEGFGLDSPRAPPASPLPATPEMSATHEPDEAPGVDDEPDDSPRVDELGGLSPGNPLDEAWGCGVSDCGPPSNTVTAPYVSRQNSVHGLADADGSVRSDGTRRSSPDSSGHSLSPGRSDAPTDTPGSARRGFASIDEDLSPVAAVDWATLSGETLVPPLAE